jgi:hypothetical protein
MKIYKGFKEIYQGLSGYNRDKMMQANRPLGKDTKEFMEMLLWLLAVLSIIGAIMNVQYERGGFLLRMFTNFSWSVINLRRKFYAQSFLFGVYFALSLWGWISWQR